MNKTVSDYTRLTDIAKSLGFVQHLELLLTPVPGFYTLNGFRAPVDLTACAEDEISIMKTAISQLSERVDADYWERIEESDRDTE